jgi:hypothetical protein
MGLRRSRYFGLSSQAADRLSIRWYLGYDLDEPLAFSFEPGPHSISLWAGRFPPLF